LLSTTVASADHAAPRQKARNDFDDPREAISEIEAAARDRVDPKRRCESNFGKM